MQYILSPAATATAVAAANHTSVPHVRVSGSDSYALLFLLLKCAVYKHTYLLTYLSQCSCWSGVRGPCFNRDHQNGCLVSWTAPIMPSTSM